MGARGQARPPARGAAAGEKSSLSASAWRCGRSSGGDVVKLHAGRYDVISGRQHGFCGYSNSKPLSLQKVKTGPFGECAGQVPASPQDGPVECSGGPDCLVFHSVERGPPRRAEDSLGPALWRVGFQAAEGGGRR